jgi:hypothetical protein
VNIPSAGHDSVMTHGPMKRSWWAGHDQKQARTKVAWV